MIRNNVKLILKCKNLQIKDVVIEFGVTRQSIDLQLKSENIGLKTLQKYADFLQVPPYYLLLDIEELKAKLDSAKVTDDKSRDIIVICPKCKEQIKIHI